jgi:hypothetical protein
LSQKLMGSFEVVLIIFYQLFSNCFPNNLVKSKY